MLAMSPIESFPASSYFAETNNIDRDAQFRHINDKARRFLDEGLPVISVDTEKKELIGNFKGAGGEYRKKHDPLEVLDHDFMIKELGKVSPSGTSKWNKIEHRMFCYISKNWRGQPLISVEATEVLIASTTTKGGLKVVYCDITRVPA
jgi:hypothetical protein